MEKRLTAQGPKTRKSYTITLPIEWIKSYNLQKKKLVNMELVGDKVIISAKKEVPTRVTIEDASGMGVEIKKVMSLLYRLGATEIEIKGMDSKALHIIREMLEERFIGLEIIEQGKKYIIIKEISTAPSEEFKTVLRRSFVMLLRLSEECYEGMKDLKKGTEDIIYLDRGINRLTNFCERSLIKEGHAEYTKIPFLYMLCTGIEQIGDEYKWLLTNYRDKKLKSDKKILDMLKKTNSMLRRVYELMYNFNIDRTTEVSREVFNFREKILDELKEPIAANYIMSIVRRISSIINIIFYVNYSIKQ